MCTSLLIVKIKNKLFLKRIQNQKFTSLKEDLIPIMKTFLITFTFCFTVNIITAQPNDHFHQSISIEKQEQWFGGAVNKGSVMPFADGFELDLYGNNEGN